MSLSRPNPCNPCVRNCIDNERVTICGGLPRPGAARVTPSHLLHFAHREDHRQRYLKITLNLETDSDSPSKSIRLRFISAKILIKKQKNIDIKITIFYIYNCQINLSINLSNLSIN